MNIIQHCKKIPSYKNTLPSRHTTWNPRIIGVENWWTRVPLKIGGHVFHVDLFMCIISVDLHVDIK